MDIFKILKGNSSPLITAAVGKYGPQNFPGLVRQNVWRKQYWKERRFITGCLTEYFCPMYFLWKSALCVLVHKILYSSWNKCDCVDCKVSARERQWLTESWQHRVINYIESKATPTPFVFKFGDAWPTPEQYRELISCPEPTAHKFPILPIGSLVLAKRPQI